ncbi:hypothetical protein THER5_0501 [Bifidobacterium thermacidophilum subsp. thermacidophilum]|uniref:Uncharacterized protein n=1 Tax=Bifidobacterium thermacidophilum subsp. thermacidophilum TaxID=79262 RepID=A0A087E3I0_9BIFI|nr:hypothetical protein THER5_0501 [Bifidobacterium thermacidophilum subsp. thermacidophilum]
MIADGWAGSSEWGFDRIGGHRVRMWLTFWRSVWRSVWRTDRPSLSPPPSLSTSHKRVAFAARAIIG